VDNEMNHEEIIAEAGGLVDESSATLGIYGETLDPEIITMKLCVSPTKAFKKGFCQGSSSMPSPHGAWILKVSGESPVSPQEHLQKLIMMLPSDTEIWKEINRIFKVRLCVSIHMLGWNKGFSISSGILKKISEIGLSLEFDIYTYDDED